MDGMPRHKTIRLQRFDYHSRGVYHVIICSRDRQWVFGRVDNGKMCLNHWGEVADAHVRAIPQYYSDVCVIAHIVMPNHVHMLLGFGTETDAKNGVPTVAHHLGQVVGAYKAGVSRELGRSIWQSRFYEHIIRGERDFMETVAYIHNNPLAWDDDMHHKPR